METKTVPPKAEKPCSRCSWRYQGNCLHPKGKLGNCPMGPSRSKAKAKERPPVPADDAVEVATPVLEAAAAGPGRSR